MSNDCHSKQKAHGERDEISQKHESHQFPCETEPQSVSDKFRDENNKFRHQNGNRQQFELPSWQIERHIQQYIRGGVDNNGRHHEMAISVFAVGHENQRLHQNRQQGAADDDQRYEHNFLLWHSHHAIPKLMAANR